MKGPRTKADPVAVLPFDAILPLRWRVLRAGRPREDALFPGDEAASTVHLGIRCEGVIAAVVSLYPNRLPDEPVPAWQLRGMAVAPEQQGRGLGTALLQHAEETVRSRGAKLLWCNARLSAESFYARHAYTPRSGVFDIQPIGPHRIYAKGL